jgi:hypothetical protein
MTLADHGARRRTMCSATGHANAPPASRNRSRPTLRDVIAAHSLAAVPTKLDREGAAHGPDLMVLSYLRGLPGEREANTETADATDEAAMPPHGTR